jgi:Flp pilus assembly protein TadG
MRGRRRAERGAASVEFAAVLPLAIVALLLLVQVALLVSEQLSVQHAAREGARAAAVWNDDERARDAALEAGALDANRTTVDVEPAQRSVGDPVRVTIRYAPRIVVPLVGAFVPSGITLHASVEMRTEREAPP